MRTKPRRWIGVDGEGVGRAPHRYVLLACSDGDYIESRDGLSAGQCLDFLLRLSTRDARVCGYYLGYDWTMILQDLDEPSLHDLFRPELRARPNGGFRRIQYDEFTLHWLAGAMWINDGRRSVTIWDLGKYYQGPFCKVEEGKLIGCLPDWNIRPDVQARIASMKDQRSAFSWKQISKIRRYCIEECEALAEFGDRLETAHTAVGLKPRGWFGPGSTASALLKLHDIHERRGILPPALVDPVARAFFGGRAETSRCGCVPGPIGAYDISSAYPAHASRLPCLEHGRWERVTTEKALRGRGVAHGLVYGHIRDAAGAWAPLPVRLADGSIVYPRSGASGWWWRDEWQAARRGWGKGVEFDRAFVLRRECDCKPFAFLPDVFKRRMEVGKDTGEGKVLKLAPNSVYGKLAQQVGGAQYASRVWAGMVTSGTRAQVLDLMLRHKRLDSVLMIATDGLFSTELLDVDDQIVLGGWERKVYDSITLVRPGIYWLDDTKLRARGLGRDALAQAKRILDAALKAGLDEVRLPNRTRFGGAKVCVQADAEGTIRRSEHYGTWFEIPTRQSLTPGPKRARGWATHALEGVESAPYGTAETDLTGVVHEYIEYIRDIVR